MSQNPCLREHIRLLRDLRAVRKFEPTPVPESVLDDIYEVTRWTGSAENRQPWELVVIRDRSTLNKLAALPGYAEHLASAPLGIILVMDSFDIEFATYDEGRLAERIMLAAAAHGLGSCIGWWPENARKQAKAIIGAPEERIVRTALSIGYPAGAPPRRTGPTRKPLEEIVYLERYS